MSIPSPKLFTSVPDGSNLRLGARLEPRQLFAPHRSAIQMPRPSLSISIALVDPHVRPSGILKCCSIVRYGLGRSLVGWTAVCARAIAPATIAATPNNLLARLVANGVSRATSAIETPQFHHRGR